MYISAGQSCAIDFRQTLHNALMLMVQVNYDLAFRPLSDMIKSHSKVLLYYSPSFISVPQRPASLSNVRGLQFGPHLKSSKEVRLDSVQNEVYTNRRKLR